MFKKICTKKRIAALLVCSTMLALCACGKNEKPDLSEQITEAKPADVETVIEEKTEPTPEPEIEITEEAAPEPEEKVTEEPEQEKAPLGPEEIYAQVLDGYYADIVSEFPIDNYFPMTLGTFETSMGSMGEEALKKVGYAMKDINGDGTQELMIVEVSDQGQTKYFGERILALYTIVNDEAHFITGGWARNRYFLLNDGRIFNEGSSGANDASFETYRLIENSGILEMLDSKDLSSVDYTKQLEELGKLIEKVEIRTFAEHETADNYPESAKMFWSAVYVNPAENTFASTGSDSYVADSSDYACKLVFFTPTEVSGFKFNSLTPMISDDGEMNFIEEELYSLDSLVMDKAVTITMEFAGDTPHYGIAYTDASGNVRKYAVCESGFDGSIYLSRY